MKNPEDNPAAKHTKAQRQPSRAAEIAHLEADLLADIEAFDLDAAERRARREYRAQLTKSSQASALVFPEIAPNGKPASLSATSPERSAAPAETLPLGLSGISNDLLAQLRLQASKRQHELDSAHSERRSSLQTMDKALREVFHFLEDFARQLNIIKPEIPRRYPLVDDQALSNLQWQEGFADYRTQAQSAGGLLELVTFSCHLASPATLTIPRDGLVVERFRTQLFEYGLQFSSKEFRNERHYVERAEFEIQAQLSVSARWRADFAQGKIIVDTRNLERLGSFSYPLFPQSINPALLDEFGRLVLGLPNRFREMIRP